VARALTALLGLVVTVLGVAAAVRILLFDAPGPEGVILAVVILVSLGFVWSFASALTSSRRRLDHPERGLLWLLVCAFSNVGLILAALFAALVFLAAVCAVIVAR
jgi:hypothetical protein